MEMDLSNSTVSVACTWGEGPDVLMDFSRNNRLYKVDLTWQQAEQLSYALLNAARQAHSLDDLAKEHDANMDV